MLPRKFRISVVEFNRSKTKAVSFFSVILNISVKPNNLSHTRFTVSVPKYLDKRSTKRHQTKRIIIRELRDHLPKITGSGDILIKAKKILGRKESFLTKKSIISLLQKAGLI